VASASRRTESAFGERGHDRVAVEGGRQTEGLAQRRGQLHALEPFADVRWLDEHATSWVERPRRTDAEPREVGARRVVDRATYLTEMVEHGLEDGRGTVTAGGIASGPGDDTTLRVHHAGPNPAGSQVDGEDRPSSHVFTPDERNPRRRAGGGPSSFRTRRISRRS
jgi:hypothetical protein